ncbi:mismatch repair endonuclease PMS2 [Toxorhynchites rutilus septentrionalis]|uniref:mismatch repair endonuclease PMS2 n=1 Tax=Toxorhynchites rutilus septentrionalis TaxID=329112 RepID=UPI002478CA21|nr:mismatch repair endonuclease PMS2 [Toxorhynchites rutilus septentrionalis]
METEDAIQPTPTSETSKKINAIDKDTVHRICSGQVVLNLATAVKELVENSIDAGATSVEIRLKDYGADLVEVSDNGSGVEESNFEGLTAKYHTSKLKDFSDLACIETFGFRGEALSSLCALSDMVVVTRHESAPHGTKLDLNNRGVISKRSPCARAIGTTISLSNLFSTLPVRKKEFQKNVKREFTKMCQILQAYCLVSIGVRIVCTNQNKKGAKTVVMNTQGKGSVLDNIITVFGSKQAAELIELKPAISSSGKIMDLNESDFDDSLSLTQEEVDNLNLSRYTIDGYVSSCDHGSGRSTKDRQFFFVNSRPCEPKQIIKLVNETYHKYNANQSPFVFLNLKMDRGDVDVNLTPDKRQILLNNEKILLLALKKSLLKTYGNIPSTFKRQNLNVSGTTRLLNISFESDREVKDDDTLSDLDVSKQSRLSDVLNQWKATRASEDGQSVSGTGKRKREKSETLPTMHDFIRVTPRTNVDNGNQSGSDSENEHKMQKMPKMIHSSIEAEEESLQDGRKIEIMEPKGTSDNLVLGVPLVSEEKIHLTICRNKSPSEGSLLRFEKIQPDLQKADSVNGCSPEKRPITIEDAKSMVSQDGETQELIRTNRMEPVEVTEIEDIPNETDISFRSTSRKNIHIDIVSLKDIIKQEQTLIQQKTENRKTQLNRLKFKSKINPTNNRAAEDELQTEISKEKFSQMEIIGQFNLGFIIVRLEQDLFIIDQHATDEKYNFEDLQKNTVLQSQKLVVPQPLELTAVNEMILMDNLEVFEMNGFKFEIDGGALPTQKVKLLSKPFSKNWEFGKEDIDELVFMLQDAPPNTICRPSRVRAMFASRACRKSVMIGKALPVAEMRKLVNHMGEIEQPWNCPHGRPTMRHLVNLAMIRQTENSVEQLA